jgi:diguanylate cyclase (GGDEF)-like protein/PAS domain S-box-containing protein
VLATRRQEDVLAPWRGDAIARMMFVFALISLIAIIGAYLVRQLRRGQQMAAALATKEASFRMLAENSSDMVTRIGPDDRIQYISPSSLSVLGWPAEKLLGMPALSGVDPVDLARINETLAGLRSGKIEEARMTYRTRHREKSQVWVESTVRATRDVNGVVDGVVAVTRDVTEQKDLQDKLAALAIEDGLTGLANRRRFDERLSEEWNRAQREGTSLALLMIDLDHFKIYNDKYGHLAGDECLRRVARVLMDEARRPADLAARFGGEEFAVLLPNTDAAGCALIGERVRHACRELGIPHALNLPSGVATTSIGGAVSWPGTERSGGPLSLIEAADRALYAAKSSGRDRLMMSGEVVTFSTAASA